MTRSFLLTVFLFGVLFCAPHNALAADWLEPGVYTETDSKKSGEVHAFGNAERLGDLSDNGLSDLASVASSNAGSGYFVATTAGKIQAFGDAIHRGDLGAISLDAPVADLAITPDGNGYWLVTTAGTCLLYTSPSPRD